VHGDARSGEGWRGDDDELYAWRDAEASEDERRVLELVATVRGSLEA